MSKIINLPSGKSATLRDPRELKQKDRKKLYSTEADGTVAGGMNMMDNLLSILIEEWTFDLIPPSVKIDSLGELSIADYDVLMEAANEALPVLFPKTAATEETEADPKAPTGNSNA